MSSALALCHAQLSDGKSRQQIATEIGYSRTAVSLYLSGKYGGDTERLEKAIRKEYDRVACPHTGESIDPSVCKRKALSPKPFGGFARSAWWVCCQTCPHKPEKKS